jgi:tetratricopeptide (TPR) repeat protein
MPKLARKLLLPLLVLVVPVAGFIGYRLYMSRTSYLLARGHAAIEQGDFATASRLVEQLESKGEVQPARLLRAEALIYASEAAIQGEVKSGVSKPAVTLALFRKALDDLEQIPDDGPLGTRGSVLAAECLIHLQQQHLAEERLQAVIDRDPDNRDAHRLLAGLYMDLNSRTRAIAEFQEWARLDPDNGLPYRWIGFFQRDYEATDEAIEAYTQALARRLLPEIRSAVWHELAQCYIAEGKFQEALNTLSKGPAEFNADPKILALRVECYLNLHREQEAIEPLEQGMRQHPDIPVLLRLRGQLFAVADKPTKAEPFLAKAIRLDPSDLKAQMLLVDVYRQEKQTAKLAAQSKVLAQLQKTRQRLASLIASADPQPWNDRLRVQIAVLCMQLHDNDLAQTWLRAALASNPGNSQARKLLSELLVSPKP